MTARPTLFEIARELSRAVSAIDRAEPGGDADARVRAWERAYRAQDALDAFSGQAQAVASLERDAARGAVVRRAHALLDFLARVTGCDGAPVSIVADELHGHQVADLLEALETALAACGWPVECAAAVALCEDEGVGRC